MSDVQAKSESHGNPAVQPLQRLMRWFGLLCVIAFFPFVMPVSWMNWCHQQLDLGSFPTDKPIAIYLARSTSALCGLYGTFALVLATDVVKYQRLILSTSVCSIGSSAHTGLSAAADTGFSPTGSASCLSAWKYCITDAWGREGMANNVE